LFLKEDFGEHDTDLLHSKYWILDYIVEIVEINKV
jgi:hypothetical protein